MIKGSSHESSTRLRRDVFVPALDEMSRTGSLIFGPKSFQRYLIENNFPLRLTAPLVSVDSFELLSPSLRENGVMVLRLGTSPDNRGTQFVLVKTENLSSFFLEDSKIFTQKNVEEFPTKESYTKSLYQVLPALSSERFLINLALTSGLLGLALELESVSSAATCQSTFSFNLRLHSSINQIYRHDKGQVEIDSIFLGRKNGRDVIFVIEAKSNKSKSLAKHKLVYPVLAIVEANEVPSEIQVVPVYVKISTQKDGFYYNIVECELPDPRTSPVAIDELKPLKHTYLFLSKN